MRRRLVVCDGHSQYAVTGASGRRGSAKVRRLFGRDRVWPSGGTPRGVLLVRPCKLPSPVTL
eukprot:3660650-Prymnesium_polylepis.1